MGGSMIPLICVNRDKVMICETDGFFFYFPVLIKTKTNTRPVQSCTGRLAVRSVLVYRIPCSDSFGCVFACEAAEGYAAACGGTAHEVGIASCKVVAGAIMACRLSSIWMPSIVQMKYPPHWRVPKKGAVSMVDRR